MDGTGSIRIDYHPRIIHTHSQPNTARSQRNRPSDSYRNGTYSDGERMCTSDMESSTYRIVNNSSRYRPISKPIAGKNPPASENAQSDALTSLSLPNVLGDDVQLVCREFELKCECPPKSASGDNFLEMHQTTRDYDNISEGSYRLSDYEQYSTYSDVPFLYNPVYSTTFTTKRVGDVIVKKVISSNSRSTFSNADDESCKVKGRIKQLDTKTVDNLRENIGEICRNVDCFPGIIKGHESYNVRKIAQDKQSSASSSAPSSLVEYPLHRKLVPIEIDGPNIKLDEYKNRIRKNDEKNIGKKEDAENHAAKRPPSIIYTSKGVILQKPKVIPDVDTYRVSESIYSQINVTQSSASAQNSTVITQPQAIPKTYGAIGPLPGKVITKEDLMITPDGIREKRVKPIVPPKPKNLCSPSGNVEEISELKDIPPHPIVNLQKEEFTLIQRPKTDEAILQRPTLISVQSEDEPEIQKYHLFNSDIPYVLTMRNISTDPTDSSFSTFKDPTEITALPNSFGHTGSLVRNRKQTKSPEMSKRRKSLDLVPRKRLPSPGNYSSQDHSISPTTPESGDILEYLLKRRSQEKTAIVKKGRRGDPRRQTQPVRFNLPPSPEIENQKIASLSQPNLNGNDVMDIEEEIIENFVEEDTKKIEDDQRSCGEYDNVSPKFIQADEADDKSVEQNCYNTLKTEVNEIESLNGDDFPPPPPPPPLLPEITIEQINSSTILPESVRSSGVIQDTTDLLPFVDDSLSSKTSQASKEDGDESKDHVTSSSTLRTPTGVLWTDF